jgi:hypothetical protein
MVSSTFSNPALWATLACAAAAVAVIFENKADLAKFIQEPGIKSLSWGTVLVMLTTAAAVLMALAFLISYWVILTA